ncbi:hypothetical protein Kpho02_69760 [Kitasatospora phosalacinea]|uniref:Uncharacterized protein n=2 Tax=Kitasatospora phosalacinea TaxID=2065 RepID=A0A9W6QH16_9ACTN|nr:hypothetical protein Kpho02_69760 [Kitasatospora phosalacinea]
MLERWDYQDDHQHPMVALYPGAFAPRACVHAHVVGANALGEVLAVHVTRYPLVEPEELQSVELPRTLWRHTFAVVPPRWSEIEPTLRTRTSPEHRSKLEQALYRQQRVVESASVIVARATPESEPPMILLDTLMRRHLTAEVVGVLIDDRTCLVGVRARRWNNILGTRGYAVTVRADGPKPGPLSLYPSAIYGWSRWWYSNALEFADRRVERDELPPPPPALDIVEAWQPYRLALEEPERTDWPQLPERGDDLRWDLDAGDL